MKNKQSFFRWCQFAVGGLLFAAMLYFHVYRKELDTMLFLVPGFLMGADPSKFFKNK